MVGFRPFHGSLVRPEFVRRVPAPAFDSMSVAERTEYLKTHPESYTLVTRSPGDGGPADDLPSEALIELGSNALQRILDIEAFAEVPGECFFLYRLELDRHVQLGVVGLVDVDDYIAAAVKRHERVAPDRAEHLSRHFERVGVQSSPIALGYRQDLEFSSRLDAIADRWEPILSFTSGDGLRQAVWVVDDAGDIDAITEGMAGHDLYIMDGHHRAAAAGLLRERFGTGASARMLGVLFDASRLRIEPFHRRVIVPEHLDPAEIHSLLVELLQLTPDPVVADDLPASPDGIGVWSDGQWWSGVLPAARDESPVAAIDPVRLQELVIDPILGIDPESPDGMLGYFLDTFDRDELSRLAPDRELLFILRPVTPDQVFAVADAGLVMPPKSTYVTPKPRSGVFLRRF